VVTKVARVGSFRRVHAQSVCVRQAGYTSINLRFFVAANHFDVYEPFMPEQALAQLSPRAAARLALRAAEDSGSEAPLLDAAKLLIAACRQADTSDPEWRHLIEELDGQLASAQAMMTFKGLRVSPLLRVV
jgi:hypothetical protein